MNDIDNLQYMRLVDLREIGRKVGVKAPSTITKKQLVTEIKDVLTGKKEPYKTNLGRPYTPQYFSLSDLESIKTKTIDTKKIEELTNKFVRDLIKIINN